MTLTSDQITALNAAITALGTANAAYDALTPPDAIRTPSGQFLAQVSYASANLLPLFATNNDLFFAIAQQLYAAALSAAGTAAAALTSNLDKQMQIIALADAPDSYRQAMDTFTRSSNSIQLARSLSTTVLVIFNTAAALVE